jgi:hypothetical protein
MVRPSGTVDVAFYAKNIAMFNLIHTQTLNVYLPVGSRRAANSARSRMGSSKRRACASNRSFPGPPQRFSLARD